MFASQRFSTLGLAAILLTSTVDAHPNSKSGDYPEPRLQLAHTCVCPPPSQSTTAGPSIVTVTETITVSATSGPSDPTATVTITVTPLPSMATKVQYYPTDSNDTVPVPAQTVTLTESVSILGGSSTQEPSAISFIITQSHPSGSGEVTGPIRTITTTVPGTISVSLSTLQESTRETSEATLTTTPGSWIDSIPSSTISTNTSLTTKGMHYCTKRTCYNSHGALVTTLPPTETGAGPGCSVSTVMTTVYNTITQTFYAAGAEPITSSLATGNATSSTMGSGGNTTAMLVPRQPRLDALAAPRDHRARTS